MFRNHLLIAVLLFLTSIGVAQAQTERAMAGPKNGVILIIRHGEKTEPPAKKDHGLSAPGRARAQAYVRYFSTQSVDGLALKPDELLATAESKSSNRPYLTIKPLADSLGKTTLVSWHHGRIAAILAAFGANPAALLGPQGWPGDEFGWLVILRFKSDGTLASSVVVNEKLMPDDRLDPPKP